MKNLGQLMKQAQAMQAKMEEMQESLANAELTGAAGAGLVEVTLNGKGAMLRLKIDPALVKPEEVEILEDLVVAAHGDARAKVDAHVKEQTSKMMGGMDLPPGFKLPF